MRVSIYPEHESPITSRSLNSRMSINWSSRPAPTSHAREEITLEIRSARHEKTRRGSSRSRSRLRVLTVFSLRASSQRYDFSLIFMTFSRNAVLQKVKTLRRGRKRGILYSHILRAWRSCSRDLEDASPNKRTKKGKKKNERGGHPSRQQRTTSKSARTGRRNEKLLSKSERPKGVYALGGQRNTKTARREIVRVGDCSS